MIGETQPGSSSYYLLGLDVIGQQGGANWSYFGYDGLGSVRQVTNSTGTIGYSANYDPYGAPLEQFGTLITNLGFTGEYSDPSGLLYLRARYANPSTGTFLTRDPFEGVMMRAMSRNGYSYVEGNPVNYADPSGKFWPAAIGAAILVAKIAVIATAAVLVYLNTYRALDAVRCANNPSDPSCNDGSDPIRDLQRICTEILNPPQSQTTDPFNVTTGAKDTARTSGNATVQTITQDQARVRENEQDESVDVVYRNPSINPPQHPEALITGFYAKNPNATYTIEGHVLNAGKKNFQSQYISVTRDLGVAIRKKQLPPIYAIDLNKVEGIVYDLTIPSVFDQYLKGTTARNFARDSEEALVVGWIPPTAILYLIE